MLYKLVIFYVMSNGQPMYDTVDDQPMSYSMCQESMWTRTQKILDMVQVTEMTMKCIPVKPTPTKGH